MLEKNKQLSIAFVWHMHQPVYKDPQTGEYLMPWTRLHAAKDYLDMLLITQEFDNIKQTFNIVPSLIDQLDDYGHNNAQDTHSKITLKDTNELTSKEKQFILDHFFDAHYLNMIAPHEAYNELYKKRHEENISIEDFSEQEYSDIIMWFNLVWFDPYWIENNKDIQKLYNKGKGYTSKDRKQVIEIQRDIIRQIIPTYKDLYQKGKIEITTSPYYHPILPLLIDVNSCKKSTSGINLPDINANLKEDAKNQILLSIQKFEETFGSKPKGLWPSEQGISPETIDMMTDCGIQWAISDEGILAKTLKKEFVRDFRGILDNPYDLSLAYQTEFNNKKLSLVFRNNVLANLISFEYGNHKPHAAANDLYERIKTVQRKLQSSPDEHHIITIAMDGENCWESYENDGRPFLKELYKMFSEDATLNITTVSDFLDKTNTKKPLNDIYTGSWINRNFEIWIGDPVKNLAWDYLSRTRADLLKILSEHNYDAETIKKAWKELYIAEGSDWFWWYGEPNDSGQDDLFDHLYRSHLINIYNLLNKPVPNYLKIPIENFIGKPSRNPTNFITPTINGKLNSEKEWANAGCIEIEQGPMHQTDKIFNKIMFGNDYQNIYFLFDINKLHLNKTQNGYQSNEINIYFIVEGKSMPNSPIRIRNKGNSILPSQKYLYNFELEIPINQNYIFPPFLSEAAGSGLWKLKMNHNIKYAYKDVLEIAIPIKDLDIEKSCNLHFIITTSKTNILQDIIPKNQILTLKINN